jgi:hypothetical protein
VVGPGAGQAVDVQVAAVDGLQHAAQYGDAEGTAELAGQVVHR